MRLSQKARGMVLQIKESELTIEAVTPGSAADEAGLERGDCIVSLFGMPFSSCLREELLGALFGECLVGVRNSRTGRMCQRWINLGRPDSKY